jgi:peptidylamidoglycolate lyase
LHAQSEWKVVQKWPPVPGPGRFERPSSVALGSGLRFERPSAVAVDSAGRVILFHRGEPALVRLRLDGTFDKAWGTGFIMAHGIKIAPDGNIWVTDAKKMVIIKYSPEGQELLTIGTPGKNGNDRTHFDGVADIAFQPNGDFYVADGYQNTRVIKFDKNGKYLFEWGKKGTGPGEFVLPHAVVLDSQGRVYVGDRSNKRIQIFTPEGKYITEWHTGSPYGLAISPGGDLWMADALTNKVSRIDRQGKVVESFSPPDDGGGIANGGPHLISFGPDGSMYVASPSRGFVWKFAKR